ncbi:MAG: hypothetical protein EOM20_03205 [Spartobacteria bacterium]|nr:hypothetical protein [Spartobacteria bacterium]
MWRRLGTRKRKTVSDAAIYAPPRRIENLEECYFYHTIDLPGHGVIEGEWDLRAGVDEYLGHVPLDGRRVLEVGTANGFLCFAMEARGAEMVAYDLSDEYDWDIVPFGGGIAEDLRRERKQRIRQLNNAWWLTHRLMNSRAKVCYGTAYTIPEAIGPVDIATFGCILLHLRDPFLALQRAAALARDTIIVTDVMPGWGDPNNKLPMTFIPDPAQPQMNDSWWYLSPEQVSRFLGVLGYPHTTITYHQQPFKDGRVPLYTVVGSVAP